MFILLLLFLVFLLFLSPARFYAFQLFFELFFAHLQVYVRVVKAFVAVTIVGGYG